MSVNIPVSSSDIIVLIVLIAIVAVAIRVFASFWAKPKTEVSQIDLDGTLRAGSKIQLTVDGMQCGMCEMHVKDSIRKAVPKAKNLKASHTTGKARFILPESMTGRELEERLHETIDPNGYRLIGMEAK